MRTPATLDSTTSVPWPCVRSWRGDGQARADRADVVDLGERRGGHRVVVHRVVTELAERLDHHVEVAVLVGDRSHERVVAGVIEGVELDGDDRDRIIERRRQLDRRVTAGEDHGPQRRRSEFVHDRLGDVAAASEHEDGLGLLDGVVHVGPVVSVRVQIFAVRASRS